MGRPLNTHNAMVRSPNVARIQSVQQQRDETQRRQFALALQEEAAHKESQVQDSHKSESAQIRKDAKKKEKRKKQRRKEQSHGKSTDEKKNPIDEKHHIDLKID